MLDENIAIGRLREHFRIHNDGRPTPLLDEAELAAYKALSNQYWLRNMLIDYEKDPSATKFVRLMNDIYIKYLYWVGLIIILKSIFLEVDMKALGYTQFKFKKNNGEWHDLIRTKIYYEEPHETREHAFTYEEFLINDFEIRNEFSETKDSIFPWGKKCLHWENWLANESEWIYPGDTLTFKQVWVPENNISFHKLMEKMRAEDFITYCKDKGISIAVNTQC